MHAAARTTSDDLRSKLAEIAAKRDALAQQLLEPDVLADHHKVRELSVRKAAIDPVADAYRRSVSLENEAAEYRAAIEAGDDAELVEMAKAELPGVEEEAQRVLDEALAALVSSDDRAIGSVVLEIRAGVGGDEAGIWANDIMGMYHKFAQERGWSIELMDADEDEAAGTGGIRSAVLSVSGEAVWWTLTR